MSVTHRSHTGHTGPKQYLASIARQSLHVHVARILIALPGHNIHYPLRSIDPAAEAETHGDAQVFVRLGCALSVTKSRYLVVVDLHARVR